MIMPQPYKCDECPTQKTDEQNGWFIGFEPVTHCFQMTSPGERALSEGVALFPWNDDVARYGKDVVHLCSVTCASKWLSKRIAPANEVPPSQR